MSGSQIDLNSALPARATLKIDPAEHPKELEARLKAEGRHKLIEDCKEVATFVAILLALVLVGGLAAYEGFFNTKASPEATHWGSTTLTTILAGAISFVLGRKVAKTPEA